MQIRHEGIAGRMFAFVIACSLFCGFIVQSWSDAPSHSADPGRVFERLLSRLAGEEPKGETRRVLPALIKYHAGMYADSIKQIEQDGLAEGANTTTGNAVALIYAEACRASQRSARGKGVLRSVVKRDPKNSRALYLLGVACIQSGGAEEGVRFLKRSADLGYSLASYELSRLSVDAEERLRYRVRTLSLEPAGSPLARKLAAELAKEYD